MKNNQEYNTLTFSCINKYCLHVTYVYLRNRRIADSRVAAAAVDMGPEVEEPVGTDQEARVALVVTELVTVVLLPSPSKQPM